MYGIQGEGFTLGCTNVMGLDGAPPLTSAPRQAQQTCPSQWDLLQRTNEFDNVLSSKGHGIARQDVRAISVRWFSAAASRVSVSASIHDDSIPQGTSHCLLEDKMDFYYARYYG